MKHKKTDEASNKAREQVYAENMAESAPIPEKEEPIVPSSCEDDIQSLKVKLEELNDKYLRLYSDFDNYRKRTSREKIELSKHAGEHLIVELLPVLDDMDRALKSMEGTSDMEAVKTGVQLISAKLRSILGSKGLQEIESIGQDFTTDLHEAVTHFPVSDDSQKNKVIDEIQKGYKLHEKVIRFAKVVIGS